MASGGKAVIFVTHSTLSMHICDKIAFIGTGGNLCFCGSYKDALDFFGISDIVDVFNILDKEPKKWKDAFALTARAGGRTGHGLTSKNDAMPAPKPIRRSFYRQFALLCKRYLHSMLNDRLRTFLLISQAPLLGFLVSLVADGKQYESFGTTRSLLFALACSAFWIGVSNSIQEVCKERDILKREYMTGLRIGSYVMSKVAVLAIVCLIQALGLVSVFAWRIGLPAQGVLGADSFYEIAIVTFLTILAASATGILASSLFKSADRAMTIAPLLLMPQLLFSRAIFQLDGITDALSFVTASRWAMQSLGTTANLNTLDIIMEGGAIIPQEFDSMFEFSITNMAWAWMALCALAALCTIAATIVLRKLK